MSDTEESSGSAKVRGRPRKADAERARHVVSCRLADDEHALWLALVERRRAGLGAFGGRLTSADVLTAIILEAARGGEPAAPPAPAPGASTPLPPAAVAPEPAPEPAPPSAPEESPVPPSARSVEGDDSELRDAAVAYQERTGKQWIEIAAAIGWNGSALSSWARRAPVNDRGTLRAISPERRAALVKLLRAKK